MLPGTQGCLLWASGKGFSFTGTQRAEKDHFFGSVLSRERYWTETAILQLRGQSQHGRGAAVISASVSLNRGGSAPSGPIPDCTGLFRHVFVLWDNTGLFRYHHWTQVQDDLRMQVSVLYCLHQQENLRLGHRWLYAGGRNRVIGGALDNQNVFSVLSTEKQQHHKPAHILHGARVDLEKRSV